MKEFQRGWIFAFGMGKTRVFAIRMRNEIVSKWVVKERVEPNKAWDFEK